MGSLQALAAICPWPEQRPQVQDPPVPGWLGDGARELLERALSERTRLVVELGAWVGLSTRFIADRAPGATIITIDHWKGSPEHQRNPEWKVMLPSLHETFLALCWDYRQRLIPLRMTTLDGLRQVAEQGLDLDLIYVDAEHSYEATSGELELIHHLFPRVTVVGDDYDWAGVAPAVTEAAARHGWSLETAGTVKRGRAWKLVPPEPSPPAAVEAGAARIVDRLRASGECDAGPHDVRAIAAPADPQTVDCAAVRVESHDPKYLTFLNPAPESGLYPFARIVDELGRKRPDIPILVVGRNGAGRALFTCGIDPTLHENLHLLEDDGDPRRYWSKTRVALFPWLAPELSPAPAVEAMVNGIPVIASDRGSIVEASGRSGRILPLPARLSPLSRSLPTSAEMAPWIDAVIPLWDDPVVYAEDCRLALAEADRLGTEVDGGRRIACPPAPPLARSKAIVLVPYLDRIENQCERGLYQLEVAGVRVIRKHGCSAIDLARSELASEALHEGAETMLFIDSDIGFDSADALRILARPEPVVAGVYAKKNQRELACIFADGIKSVTFGIGAPAPYLLKYASGGFLRIRAGVLRRMISDLRLPLCNTAWGRGMWPFFMPAIVDMPAGGRHYLAEDWAFCHRLRQIGVNPVADTAIRLLHLGVYTFGWEDAGSEVFRYRNYQYHL